MAENGGNGALRETEARRLDLIAEIGKRRNSAVIAYLTSVRRGIGAEGHIDQDDIQIIEAHVRAARQTGAKNVDLYLMTEGGSAVVPWDLVAMIREYFPQGHFRVLLPFAAYSAGAAICLGADEIVMGIGSVLGPVDYQFFWTNGNGMARWVSTSDFQAFTELMRDNSIAVRLSRTRLIDWLSAQADVAAVGRFYRVWKENQRTVMNLLASRRPPLSQSRNERIASFMLHGVGVHAQSIRRSEARANGISYIADAEKTGLEVQIDTLFALYSDVMRLRNPHVVPSANLRDIEQRGDEVDFDAEGRHISETPVAIVESLHDTNPAYVAFDQRHWNQVPPILPPKEPVPEPEQPMPAILEPRGLRSFAPVRFASARAFPRR
jgi:Serine dehydrogenase proteinase